MRRRPTSEIIAKASAKKVSRSQHVAICIMRQLEYHTLASQAAKRVLEAMEAEKLKDARKAQVEARRWYGMYKKHGGTKPL